MDTEAETQRAIEWAIFEWYEEVSRDYEGMEPLAGPGDLKRLMGLSGVQVFMPDEAGVVILSFEFGCEWDEEHGLRVEVRQGQTPEVVEG